MEIQTATPDHIEALLVFDRECFGGFWSLSSYQKEIESPYSDLLVLMERADGEMDPPRLIGVACLWSILNEAHITALGVHPDHQRQGLGQLLLYCLLTCARQRGLEWATLEVRVSNHAALMLYQKFGFQEVGRRRRYYDDGEDAHILWRKGLQEEAFADTLAEMEGEWRDRLAARNWILRIDEVELQPFRAS